MSKVLLFATLATLCTVCVSPSAASPQGATSAKFGPSAVWTPSPAFVQATHNACDPNQGPFSTYLQCFTGQMQKAGASADAVAFTIAVAKLTTEAGIMSSFNHVGPVDIAWVIYPMRARSKYGLMLVNGSPAIVNAEDLKLLDHNGLQQSMQYQTLQSQYPKLTLYPGDRDGTTWPQSGSGPNGGVQFTLAYPMRNGCPTCAHAGFAMFNWNFDASGKFQGTSFMGMTPPPLNQSGSPSGP